MEVHYATVEDVEKIVPLFEGYLQFYEQPVKEGEAYKFIKKRLENEESVILIALHNDQAIGFVQMYPSFSSLKMVRSYILNDLYVNEANRKLGAAQALMEEAFAFCEQVGAAYISLETHPNNIQAQKLYEKMEMEHDETYWHYVKTFKKK